MQYGETGGQRIEVRGDGLWVIGIFQGQLPITYDL